MKEDRRMMTAVIKTNGLPRKRKGAEKGLTGVSASSNGVSGPWTDAGRTTISGWDPGIDGSALWTEEKKVERGRNRIKYQQ